MHTRLIKILTVSGIYVASLSLVSPSYAEPDRSEAINLIVKAGELAEKCSQDIEAHKEGENIFNSIFPPRPPTKRHDSCQSYDDFYKYKALQSFNALWSWHLSITDAYFENNTLASRKKDMIKAVQSIDSTERLLARTDPQRTKPATLDISFTDSGKHVAPDYSFIRPVEPDISGEPKKLEKTHSDKEIKYSIGIVIHLADEKSTGSCFAAVQNAMLSAKLTNKISNSKKKMYRDACKIFVDNFTLHNKVFNSLPNDDELADYFDRYPNEKLREKYQSSLNGISIVINDLKLLELAANLRE